MIDEVGDDQDDDQDDKLEMSLLDAQTTIDKTNCSTLFKLPICLQMLNKSGYLGGVT